MTDYLGRRWQGAKIGNVRIAGHQFRARSSAQVILLDDREAALRPQYC